MRATVDWHERRVFTLRKYVEVCVVSMLIGFSLGFTTAVMLR